jgi:hypothetical protein
MNLVAWNCRGLGSPSAVSNLKYLVRHHNVAILFLSETLVCKNKIEEIHYLLGFHSSFSVDRVGRSGGLAMFWQSSIDCSILDYSQNHISVEISDTNRGNWRLTGFYGYPNGDNVVPHGIFYVLYRINLIYLGAFSVILTILWMRMKSVVVLHDHPG